MLCGEGFSPLSETAAFSNAAAVGRPRAGDCSDFRQAGEAIAQLTNEGVSAVCGVFRAFGKLQIEIDDVFGVVSGIHLESMDGTADQHASGDEEHERDGNLCGDENVAQPAAAHGRRRAVALTAEESAERELSSAGASPKRMPATREMAKT